MSKTSARVKITSRDENVYSELRLCTAKAEDNLLVVVVVDVVVLDVVVLDVVDAVVDVVENAGNSDAMVVVAAGERINTATRKAAVAEIRRTAKNAEAIMPNGEHEQRRLSECLGEDQMGIVNHKDND